MEKVKVTAVLLDGKVSSLDGCVHLDGILYSAYAKKHFPNLKGTQFNLKEAIDFPLPIKRISEDTKDWYYDCSFALFQMLGEDTRMYNKRFDTTLAENYIEKPGVIETRKGKFKNYRNALNIFLAKEIVWYLTAEKKEIKDLLNTVNLIGKKRSQGVGMVKQWKVESTDEDLSYLRAVPDKEGDTLMAIRPLYFSTYNERRVSIPEDSRIGYIQMFEKV